MCSLNHAGVIPLNCAGFRDDPSEVALKARKIEYMANLTLIYGLRMLPSEEVAEVGDATLKLKNGHEARVLSLIHI